MPTTAAEFAEQLFAATERPPMRDVFALAKQSTDMPLEEIEALLEHPDEHARMGAVSVMDFLARRKSTSEPVRQALFDLYLRRHDRIDTWGLVDRAAPYVIGGHLADKPRDVLYELTRSENTWERRTAIVATYFFIRRDELDDTFAIAELLIGDDEHLIHTAVGGWIREAGKRDRDRLLTFLDRHAVTMPRVALRFAVEHLDAPARKRYPDSSRAR